jgi:hypothetical protein
MRTIRGLPIPSEVTWLSSRSVPAYPVPVAVRWLYEKDERRDFDRETRENANKKCGGGGIRTHGELAPSAVFKTASFDLSSTPPRQ